MKKDVNFGLFVLIIATLVCFAVFTTYYQDKFEKISSEYNERIDEMNRLTQHLQLEKAKLNETSFELVKTVRKADDLTDKYAEIRDNNEALQDDVEQLTTELSQKTSKLAEAELKLTQKETQLAAVEAELSVVNADLDDCEDDVDYYQDKYDECCSSGGTCE